MADLTEPTGDPTNSPTNSSTNSSATNAPMPEEQRLLDETNHLLNTYSPVPPAIVISKKTISDTVDHIRYGAIWGAVMLFVFIIFACVAGYLNTKADAFRAESAKRAAHMQKEIVTTAMNLSKANAKHIACTENRRIINLNSEIDWFKDLMKAEKMRVYIDEKTYYNLRLQAFNKREPKIKQVLAMKC